MAMLSRKTIGIAVRALEQLSGATIDLLLYENDIPDTEFVGSSKKERLLRGFRGLESTGKSDLILRCMRGGIGYLDFSLTQELTAALVRDGYVVDGHDMVPDDSISAEHRSAVEVLLGKYADKLNMTVLLHHLREGDDLYRQEKWDSSIAHARNFVEQLLSDIAIAASKVRSENPDLSKPVKVREYLQQAGFFDESERKKLVDGVYGFFSEEGSHPGISTQSAARVCLSILWSFGFYILEKFEAWQTAGFGTL